MKVLIVEDDGPMRELMKRVMGDLTDTIYEISNGGDALSAYEAHRPDWVFMDIRMRVVDGLTATQQITAAWPGARIVIVTSYHDASLREAARRAGACGYVLKENLLEMRRWLGASPERCLESRVSLKEGLEHSPTNFTAINRLLEHCLTDESLDFQLASVSGYPRQQWPALLEALGRATGFPVMQEEASAWLISMYQRFPMDTGELSEDELELVSGDGCASILTCFSCCGGSGNARTFPGCSTCRCVAGGRCL
jgi:CheY-like chemotaxis protein